MQRLLPQRAELPPILARLEKLSPTYGSIRGGDSPRVDLGWLDGWKGQNVLSAPRLRCNERIERRRARVHSSSLPLVATDAGEGTHRSLGSRACKSTSLPKLPSTCKSFESAFSHAKHAVAHKRMEKRWSPNEVLKRLEVIRQEQQDYATKQDLIFRPKRKLPSKLGPVETEGEAIGNAEHGSMVDVPGASTPESNGSSREAIPIQQAQVSGVRRGHRSAVIIGTSLPTASRASGSSNKPSASQGQSAGSESESPVLSRTQSPRDLQCVHAIRVRFDRLWQEIDDPCGYDHEEALHIYNIYCRTLNEGDTELHKDELPFIVDFMGFLHICEKGILDIADAITQYSTLSFEEILVFLRRYTEFEQQSWCDIFAKYDIDGSGTIEVTELRPVMEDLGYTPMRKMLEEALAAVDINGSGNIDLEEFKTLMVDWRKMEGLTNEEYDEMKEIFNRFDVDSDGELSPDELIRLKRYMGFRKSDVGEGHDGKGRKFPIGWKRFLTEIRHCREDEIKHFREVFSREDTDKSGELDYSELVKVIENLGWEPLKKRLEECIKEVDEDCTGTLNFEEFVQVMWLYRQPEGFTGQERDDLRAAFKKFDADDSGEMSVLELGDILRHEGYFPDLHWLQQVIDTYDVDDSGDVGIREFFKIMRSLREAEFKKFKTLFRKYDADGSGTISAKEVVGVLEELGHEVSEPIVKEAIERVDADGTDDLDWDEFVELMEIYRRLSVKEKQRRAGFDDDKVFELRLQFDSYDKDGSGDLDNVELMRLLGDLHMAPRTEFDQMHLLSVLQHSREAAEEHEGKTTFWVFLRLLRTLEDEQDRGSLAVEKRAAENARFSQDEVREFRAIFTHWHCRLAALGPGCGAAPEGKALTAEGIARVLRSIGCTLPKTSDYETLQQICVECDYDGNGFVDFPDFLAVMRRLIDDNFRGLNDHSTSVVRSLN